MEARRKIDEHEEQCAKKWEGAQQEIREVKNDVKGLHTEVASQLEEIRLDQYKMLQRALWMMISIMSWIVVQVVIKVVESHLQIGFK